MRGFEGLRIIQRGERLQGLKFRDQNSDLGSVYCHSISIYRVGLAKVLQQGCKP